MPKSKPIRRRVDKNKWLGVYVLESAKRDLKGRKNRIYYITYKVDGRKIWEKIGTASEGITPQICAEERSNRLRKARHGEQIKTSKELARERRAKDRTLNVIKKAYFDSDRGRKLKGRTTDLNRYDKHIDSVLGKRRVSSLAPLDVERVKSAMKGKAPATIANAIELLRRIINYGVRNNLCPPLGFVIQMPEVDNVRTEYLEPEEAERFVNVLDNWKRQDVARMLKLALVTGMRRGEIFKLEDGDLDFYQNLIEIRDPKGGKSMTIPMNKPAREILEAQIHCRNEEFPGSPFIFPGRAGRLRVDCSAVDRIKVKAELPKSFRIFHGIRHHFGVMLANSGEFSLDMIGELLTHKSTKMTRRYSQFLPGTVKKASEKAADLIQRQAQNKLLKTRVKNSLT